MWYGIIPLLCRSYNSMISYNMIRYNINNTHLKTYSFIATSTT